MRVPDHSRTDDCISGEVSSLGSMATTNVLTILHRAGCSTFQIMTKVNSCLDCFWQKLELALKKDADGNYSGTDDDEDDDSSDYDSDGDDSEDDSEQEEEAVTRGEADKLFQGQKLGQSTVFQSIMQRFNSAEAQADMARESKRAMKKVEMYHDDDENTRKPREHLEAILRSQGRTLAVKPYKSMSGFFVHHTPSQVATYEEIAAVVRRNKVDDLRRLHRSGRDLQCCNKFGESIVHTIARRGSPEMMKFLLRETDCSIRVCCDSGRTPVHDAAWTSSPNFDMVRLILESSPELLTVSDNRDFICLDYVPRDCWGLWCKFLDDNKDLLVKD